MSFEVENYLVTIDNVSLSNLGFIIFLKREGDKRLLPIFIGGNEAQSISAYLSGETMPRPLSHDLFKNVLDLLHSQIQAVLISELRDGTFYARILLKHAGQIIDIDARPSDAIAMALRCGAQIRVATEVFEEAAVQVEATSEQSDNVKKLNAEMQKAVDEERYEDAARLRDQLKNLQQGN